MATVFATAEPIVQTNRLLTFKTVLNDALLPTSFTAVERISGLFRIDVEMLSDRSGPSVPDRDLLGTQACLSVCVDSDYQSGPRRYFNGIVSRFYEKDSDDRFLHLGAEIVPWLWLLTLDSDCRIFQSKTIPEIVESIFEEYRSRFPKLVAYRFATTKSYTKLDYCVQYRESSFNFISRLLEEDGIFYYFEHSRDKHTLVLADSPSALKASPNQGSARLVSQAGYGEFDSPILSWTQQHELRPGKYTLRDFHFQTPGKTLQVNESTLLNNAVGKQIEIYNFPGEYASRFTEKQRVSEIEPEAEKAIRLRIEEIESTAEQISGTSLCRDFTAGQKFQIVGNFSGNRNLILTSVEHRATQTPWYLAQKDTTAEEEPYENRFTCVTEGAPLRPLRTTPKPTVTGPQTAVVVGKEGEDIWTDQFGRVKVQFHWDREGKANENSSCWIRVSQPWAGSGWGAVSIPRVGQEVIVDFLEGDPDQPIITGRVYNASQMPPYELPDGGHMMGFRSKSTKGGVGYNEIVIHDSKEGEKLIIHAQKDMTTAVEQDQTNTVLHGNQLNAVNEGAQQTVVKKDVVLKSSAGQVYIEASTQITLKVGDSALFMDKDGNIVLQGKHLYIAGSSLTEIKGQPVQINCD